MFVHIDFEGYTGVQMSKTDGVAYTLRRMCPPGTIHYFFTERTKDGYVSFCELNNNIPLSLELYVNHIF
jgi:hypothetical protein